MLLDMHMRRQIIAYQKHLTRTVQNLASRYTIQFVHKVFSTTCKIVYNRISQRANYLKKEYIRFYKSFCSQAVVLHHENFLASSSAAEKHATVKHSYKQVHAI